MKRRIKKKENKCTVTTQNKRNDEGCPFLKVHPPIYSAVHVAIYARSTKVAALCKRAYLREEKWAKIMHAFFSKLDHGRSNFTESNP